MLLAAHLYLWGSVGPPEGSPFCGWACTPGLTPHRTLTHWVHGDWPRARNLIQSGPVIVSPSDFIYGYWKKYGLSLLFPWGTKTIKISKLSCQWPSFLPCGEKVSENEESKTEKKIHNLDAKSLEYSDPAMHRTRSTPKLLYCEPTFLFSMS